MDTTRRVRQLLGLLAIAALAAGCDPAAGETEPTLSACDRTLQVAQDEVAQVDVPMPDGWTLAWECTGEVNGRTSYDAHTITLYHGNLVTPERARRVWLHELGHAYDAEALGDRERGRWQQVRGLPATGQREPFAEDWAHAFSACHMPSAEIPVEPPTADQCALITEWTGLPLEGNDG